MDCVGCKSKRDLGRYHDLHCLMDSRDTREIRGSEKSKAATLSVRETGGGLWEL